MTLIVSAVTQSALFLDKSDSGTQLTPGILELESRNGPTYSLIFFLFYFFLLKLYPLLINQ